VLAVVAGRLVRAVYCFVAAIAVGVSSLIG